MKMQKISSLELHLKFPAEQIIETKCLEDVGCGIYPCYYLKCKDILKVSTSVTSLIFDSNAFKINPHFRPPNFLKEKDSSEMLRRLKKLVKYSSLGYFHINSHTEKSWYETWETIDKRVSKLKPFERVTLDNSIITFNPDCAIHDKEVIVNKTVYHLKNFVQNVEEKYPDYNQIILTGGKDSQLINLIPKLNNKKWSLFSAEPNYSLVKRWVKENGVKVDKIFTDNNQNKENIDVFKKKIVCGDLYSNPRHIRWMPTIKKIADKFNQKCIFWGGTAADAIYSFHRDFHCISKEDYFKIHIRRVSSWQGNYHQVFKNFVRCPLLSPYHSKEIWEDLYQHLDQSIITKDTDLRNEIGEELFNKPIKWLNQNPGPKIYNYTFDIDLYNIYVEYIQEHI